MGDMQRREDGKWETGEYVAKVQDIFKSTKDRLGFKTPLEVYKGMTNFEYENVALLT